MFVFTPLFNYLSRANITIEAFSNSSGISRSTLFRMKQAHKEGKPVYYPSLDCVDQICHTLHCQPADVVKYISS